MYDIHTRTRNFCKICTTVPQYPGYGYGIFITAWNFCKFCTPVLQYPELLEGLVPEDFHARTQNFCELCRTFIPVPGTSVSSVRPVPQYRGTGTAFFVPARNFCESVRLCHNTWNFCEFYNTPFHTRVRSFWKFCKTPIPLPGIPKPFGS